MAGSCEVDSEPSGSIKGGEFLGYMSAVLTSQEGLCSMEFISLLYLEWPWGFMRLAQWILSRGRQAG
jgi:hypothetical protein